MKKIALCLFGSVGFKSKPQNTSNEVLDPEKCFTTFKEILLDKYSVDIFIHTWSSDYDKKLIYLYQPKSSLIEKQINFETNLDNYSLKNVDFHDELGDLKYLNEKPSTYLKNFIFRTKSRWHSQLTSLQLMKKFKTKNNLNYDIVIQSRLDLLLKNLDLEKLDPKFINLVNATHHKINQLYDIFFVSNYENSIKFLNIKDKLNTYPICPTNVLPIFFKDEEISFRKSLNFSDFIIHRNLYKYHQINYLKRIYIFVIARIINVMSLVSDITKKIKLSLNKIIN
jgi:hypothetical protein